ncbi:MAG: tetratricopeptide repeat protein [Desulfobacterales bacterium]|nr:tetratricopeptide repeat protein [Desulfobacterales bacterium]
MTQKDTTLFHSSGSAQHFLLSKSNTRQLRSEKIKSVAGIMEVLRSAFPDMLAGQRFIEYALQQLASINQFAAMVVRVDHMQPDDEANTHSATMDGQVEVAGILDTVCQIENGMWGAFEPGLFGSFLPDKDGSESLRIARDIQKRLLEKTQKTLTIGVASYPTLTYTQPETLNNAHKALDHASFFGPNSAVVFDGVSLNISGDNLYEDGKIQEAIEELKKALMLEPSNVNVHNSLGVCYGLQGKYETATAEFNAAVSIDPDEYMALYNLGLVCMLTERRDQALEYFTKAEKINANVFEIAFHIGKLNLELGYPAKSKPYLEHAAKLSPESGTVYRYLGDCYTEGNLPQAAITAYKKAIQKNPQDAAAMSALGYILNELKENPEIALMFCRESVDLAPENALFRYRLGRLYSNQEHFDEALKEFTIAKQLGYDAGRDIQQIKDRLVAKSS